MAVSVPDGALVNINTARMNTGINVFVGSLTLDGSGDGSIAHGLPQPSVVSGANAPANVPSVVFFIPIDGADHSGATLTVDGTNVTIAGGVASGTLLIVVMD